MPAQEMSKYYYSHLKSNDSDNSAHSVDKKIIDPLYHIDETVFTSTKGSKIVDFYKGKSVFITGGTGFLGKLLIEKLLRSCQDINTIYILVRPKKGKNADARMDEIFSDIIYSQLETVHPKFRHKILAIKGDVSLPGLGIDDMERQMLINKVNVIFHVAATVRFDEKLRIAVAINIKGTKDILSFGKECKNLVSMVHVSTAYCNCPWQEINETFYKPPFTTEKIINVVDTLSDKHLDLILPSLLQKWPNTYAFTKAIAEDTVREYGRGLPICSFRPSIVTSTYKEPIRCWIDNLYGPVGVMIGAGTGVLKSIHGDPLLKADMVPADYVVNGMICASYKNTLIYSQDVPVYNFVSSAESPITWGAFTDINKSYGLRTPTMRAIWYYNFTLNRNMFIHFLYILFLHYVPALLIDGALIVSGKKPRMLKIYKKVHRFSSVLSYFATKEWVFSNHNVRNLWTELSEEDKRVYPFSMEHFNWDDYYQNLAKGIRVYLIKDDLSTVPQGLKKFQRLYLMHRTCQIVLCLAAVKIIYELFRILLQSL